MDNDLSGGGDTYHKNKWLHVDNILVCPLKLPVHDEVCKVAGFISANSVEVVPIGRVGMRESVEL